ncbi:hypothetical protein CXG81DRAFT_9821 [Caulochytrium protostelioides]|uniref:60S ribosomal protein L36 n=1 Tax=Caulochytrium protostelioides TaxID=1555241 RepID=A0A4V1IV90_9FUNG|nr:hypothetical protein CXG81DRAFT_9821 [Caulochytrium protostelioides]|eukprot:RKP03229.1 hypothetical protein CXG81DRAFT_9821 [Caulochytrium protostelioides]
MALTVVTQTSKRNGTVVGKARGHKTTRLELVKRHADKINMATKRTTFIRDLIQEVAGFAPYERRLIELLKNSRDKRAKKFCKKRLGTFQRSKRKIEQMQAVIAESRRHK